MTGISTQEVEADAADSLFSFEAFLVKLSARFVALPPDAVDTAIEEAQRDLCQAFRLDRSTLWQRASDSSNILLTHFFESKTGSAIEHSPFAEMLSKRHWVLNSASRPAAYLEMEASVFFPWTVRQLQKGLTVALTRLDDLPPDAEADRQIWERYGTVSTVVVPLAIGSEFLGCLSFTSERDERHWSDLEVKRFEMVGHLFANALARKASDKALRESELRFRMVADSAPVFIWMAGLDKKCTFVNKPWLDFTGRTLQQELGDGWATGLHPDDAAHCLRIYEQAFDARRPFILQYRLRRHDGEYRWVEDHGVPRYDEGGTFGGYIGSCTDITDRLEAEQTARDLNGLLINAQEEERARLARELHDDVTQRLGRLAIDAGRIEHAADGTAERLAAGVREALVQLSDDVHAMSYELHPSVLMDLGLPDALKAECDNLSRRHSVAAEVSLRNLPEAVPRNLAIAFFRIAQEALRNAIRHGSATRIDIALWGLDGGLQLAVRDHGIGFDPHARRARPSLGVASMKERARLVGGEFDIESEPGHGTTVLVWAPMPEDIL